MSPTRIFFIYSTVIATLFAMAFTLSGVYRVTVARLDPLQLILVGTMLELSVFVFEVPTGIVADVYSRRVSFIIAVFLISAGMLVEGSFPLFGAILLAQFLWGVGYTFTSGALQAWITDEIGEEAAGAAFLRVVQFDQVGALLGAVAGTLIGSLHIQLPYLLGGALLLVLGIFLIFFMPETGFKPADAGERTTFARMLDTFRAGMATVRARPALSSILWIGLFYGLYSEGLDRLWEAHLISRFTFPVFELALWFGGLRIASRLFNIVVVGFAQRHIDMSRPRRLAPVMTAITIGIVLTLAGFALSPWLGLSILLYWLLNALRELIDPLYTAWVNHRLDSQVRATVLSFSGQVDALGQIGGGPLVGAVASALTIRAGLLSSAALLTPAVWLFAKLTRNQAHSQARGDRAGMPPAGT